MAVVGGHRLTRQAILAGHMAEFTENSPAPSVNTNTSMSTSTDTTSNEDSLLLNAPAEIRNMIYRKVLVANRPIDLFDPFGMRNGFANMGNRKEMKFYLPGLLHTCRQIGQEARSIYYAENTFQFVQSHRWVSEVVIWLKSLRPEDLEEVCHIHVTEKRNCPFTDRAAKQFDELERQLDNVGVELEDGIVIMMVESRVADCEAPCCMSGYCGYTRHYVDRALLSDFIDAEALLEVQSEEGDSGDGGSGEDSGDGDE